MVLMLEDGDSGSSALAAGEALPGAAGATWESRISRVPEPNRRVFVSASEDCMSTLEADTSQDTPCCADFDGRLLYAGIAR